MSQPVALHRHPPGPIDRKMTAAALAVLGLLLLLLVVINGVRASKVGTLSLATPGDSGPRNPSIATAIRSRVAVTAAPAAAPAAEPGQPTAEASHVAQAPVRLRASAPIRAAAAQEVPAPEPAPTPAPAPAPTPQPASNGSRAPEITMFESTNPSSSPGERIEFRWAAGDADGLIAGAVIDFGDGSFVRRDIDHGCDEPVGAPAAEYPSFEHVYERPGDYTVTIKVFSVGQCDTGPLQSADASIGEHVAVLPGVKMAATLLP